MKDIDWKILLPVAGLTLLAGIATGVWVVKPAMDKAKAKKLLQSGTKTTK